MSNVKYSSGSYSDINKQIEVVKSSLITAQSKVSTFAASASSSNWTDKAAQMSKYKEKDEDGVEHEYTDNAAYQSYIAQIDTFNNCKKSVVAISSKLGDYASGFNGLIRALQCISDAVQEFEDSNKVVNIEELVNMLINSGQIDTSSFNVEKFSYEVNDDGTHVMYYELDGEKVTISDMLNAFYTYTGMSMSANVEGRYLAEKMGVEFDENYQMNIMNGVNGFMSDAYSNSYFGIADMDSINAAAGSLGITLDDNNDFNSILNTYGDNLNVSGLNSVLGSEDVNSLVAMGASVGGGMLAAYTLTDNLDFKKPKPETKPVNPSPDPGVTLPVEPPEPEIIKPPELVEPTQEVVPEEVVSEVTEQDFDELAREEFEAQGAEAIYERRSKVLQEVEGLIASGDEKALRDKLSEYGYSDPEVEAILQNPDYIRTACIEGDQRAALTEIANRLADEAGVKGFDTKYDDGQQYQDLQDGTTSSEYIANMSLDKNVTDARNAYKEARVEYEKAVQEANTSIADANEAKVNMENLKNEFGSDTTKWTQEQADRYNEAVNDYNDAVKIAAEKNEAIQGPKEAYLEARDNYNVAKEEFIDRIKNPDREAVQEIEPVEDVKDIRIEYDVPKDPSRKEPIQVDGDTTILPYEPEIIQNGNQLVGNPDVTVPEASFMPVDNSIIGNQNTNVSESNNGVNPDLLAALNITENGVSFK